MLALASLQADFLPFLELQSLLLEITERTSAEARDLLISQGYLMDGRLDALILLLLKAIDRRPRQIPLYVGLTMELIERKGSLQPLLQESLLSTADRKIRRLFFLRELAVRAVIPTAAVLAFIHRLFRDRAFAYMKAHRKLALAAFCWFAPEVEAEDPGLFSAYVGLLRDSHASPYFKSLAHINVPFVRDLPELQAADWRLHRELARVGASAGPFAVLIRANAAIAPEDPDARIEPALFEPCGFLNHGPTLLQYAAFHGSLECVECLLCLGADGRKIDGRKRGLSDFAIAGGYRRIIELVCTGVPEAPDRDSDSGPGPGPGTERAAKSAADDGAGGERRKAGGRRSTAQAIGAEQTFASARKRQAGQRSEPGPLSPAVSVSPEFPGATNLMAAKFHRFGAIPPAVERQSFFKACKSGCLRYVIYCIESGLDPNLCEEHSKTPAITIAAQAGCVETVRYLSRVDGINLGAVDSTGAPPLVRAAACGRLPIVEYFCSLPGVDVNAGDERETTALIWASMQGFLRMVKFLCSVKGIELNAMDEYVSLCGTVRALLCPRSHARASRRYSVSGDERARGSADER
jgi:hypothetical protein